MKFEVDNKIWQEDIESIADNKIIDSFKDSVVLITGATGLIGKELVFSFLCANRLKKLNIKVIALVRNLDKANEIFKNVINNDNFEIIVQDIIEPIVYDKKVDYIFHCANITSSKLMTQKPTQVIESTLFGTKNILDFAKNNKVKKVVYLSSLEIYGQIKKEDIYEEDYGYLDSSIIRNCYPISKKMAENLCVSYIKEFGLDIKIARLTQTFGAGIAKDDNRVFAQFAKCIIEDKDIILKTDGLSYKNYCYITDAIIALLTILLKGEKANIYNVTNYNSAITIKDLALKLINKYKSSNLKFEIGENSYNQNVYLKLNTKKLESLGFEPQICLDEMFERLIEYLKESK